MTVGGNPFITNLTKSTILDSPHVHGIVIPNGTAENTSEFETAHSSTALISVVLKSTAKPDSALTSQPFRNTFAAISKLSTTTEKAVNITSLFKAPAID